MTFKDKLQAHLQGSPYPGCIFVQAATTSDQAQALNEIRQACVVAALSSAELHPNLLGSRVIDVRNDIQQAFDEDVASSSMASAISIYPDDKTPSPRALIIPSAHLLRNTHSPLIWSQFLYPPSSYTVLLISSLPLDRWRTAEGVENLSGHRPILHMTYASSPPDLEAQLEVDDILPANFRSSFITFVLAALNGEISKSETNEINFLSVAIWRGLRAVVGSNKINTTPHLLTTLRPLIRSALAFLHTRRMGVEEWIEHVVNDTGDAIPHSSTTPALDTIPTLLLLSAFLTSHLAAKSDSRYFLRDEASLPNFTLRTSTRRKRKKSNTTTQAQDDSSTTTANSPLLLGPKPFTYQRMMYVFQNLCVEFDVSLRSLQGDVLRRSRDTIEETQPHMDIYSVAVHRHLQKLIAMQYIVVVSPPFSVSLAQDGDDDSSGPPPIPLRLEHLNQSTLRCNLLRDEVKDIVLANATTDERKQWWTRVEECGL